MLQGLPTTRMRTSEAALAAMALPWPVKILPLMPSSSLRSIPCLRGNEPTSRAQLQSLKTLLGSSVRNILERREGAIFQLHVHALQGLHRLGDLQQLQDHLLARAEHLAGGQPAQHGIGHLAGSSRHRHPNCVIHGFLCLLLLCARRGLRRVPSRLRPVPP